jgi:manganese transport protein
MERLKELIASLMPGFFLIGYNIGTGSLTAMSKAGANFGTDLLWAVLLSCVMTWFLINFYSRFTMATGMTAMEAYRRHIHPAYAWALWGGLAIIIVSAIMAMLGLLTDVILEWTKQALALEADRRIVGIGVALFVYGLIVLGNTRRFEAMLSIMVAIMGLAFIGSAIFFFPGFDAVLSGLVPRMPALAEGSDNSSLVILAGMVGTTVSVFTCLVRSGQVKDHSWTMVDWRKQKRDALVSVTMMFVLSTAVMLTATATLHEQDAKMNHIKEMIPMLEPLCGPLSLFVFLLGILAAGISSHMPNIMMMPWLGDDIRGRPRDTRSPRRRLVFGLLTLLSILGVFTPRPVFLMLLSQAGISVVMPISLLGLIYLSARRDIHREHRPRPTEWLALALIACFSLFMSFQGIKGLIADLVQL